MTATLTRPEPGSTTESGSGHVWGCYCRLSRKKGDGRGTSLAIERQCEANVTYILAQDPGARIVHFHDDGFSGFKVGLDRPHFEDMMSDVAAGRLYAVVAWHADRISRQVEVTAKVLRVCRDSGVQLHTTLGGHVADEMTLQIAAVVAEAESRQKSNRMISKQKQLAKAGAFAGGRRRFGYNANMTAVIESERVVILEMANRALVGESLRSIARWLNETGVATSSGKMHSDVLPVTEIGWRPNMVSGVLTGLHLTGYRLHNGSRILATWEPILDMATYDALLLKLADPARKRTHTVKAKYLLSGTATCGPCGKAISGTWMKKAGHVVYLCQACGRVHRKAEPIDRMVSEYVIARLEEMDAAGFLVSDEDATTIAALVSEREEIAPARAALAGMLAPMGPLTPQGYAEAEAALTEREAVITAEVARLRERTARPSRVLEGATGPNARPQWEAWTNDPSGNGVARQRAIVALLLDVKIHPATRSGRAPFDPASVAITYRDLA